ncbi:hypothetical protein [Erythrobacter alti]|uniref:hypothetical protein n=1 Tax=Erythrobacter alti TaxID=1896145 RepID=UPI0030F44A6F
MDEARCSMVHRLGRRCSKLWGGEVKIDYRPVHEYTLTDDAEYIEPKKRVY